MGYEILEALQPDAEDWYVEKTRLSAFFQTNLEQILRALNAETAIFTGVLEPVRGSHVQGCALPRLQADRRRGMRGDGDAICTRPQ